MPDWNRPVCVGPIKHDLPANGDHIFFESNDNFYYIILIERNMRFQHDSRFGYVDGASHALRYRVIIIFVYVLIVK